MINSEYRKIQRNIFYDFDILIYRATTQGRPDESQHRVAPTSRNTGSPRRVATQGRPDESNHNVLFRLILILLDMIYKIWQLSKSYQIRFSHMSFPFIPCMADGAFEMKIHYVQKLVYNQRLAILT